MPDDHIKDSEDAYKITLYKYLLPAIALLFIAVVIYWTESINNDQDNDSIAINKVNDQFLSKDSLSRDEYLKLRESVYDGTSPKGEPHIVIKIGLGVLLYFCTVVLTTSFLNFNWTIFKTARFFQKEVLDAIYNDKRYVERHPNIKNLWTQVCSKIHQNKFPGIADSIEKSIFQNYLPNDNFYAESVEMDISYEHIEGYLVEVKEFTEQVIQTQEGEGSSNTITFKQSNNIVLNKETEDKSDIIYEEIAIELNKSGKKVVFRKNDIKYDNTPISKDNISIKVKKSIQKLEENITDRFLQAYIELTLPSKSQVTITKVFRSIHDVRNNVLKRQTFSKVTDKCKVRYKLNDDFVFEFGELGTTEGFNEKKKSVDYREFHNKSVIMKNQGFVIGSHLIKNI